MSSERTLASMFVAAFRLSSAEFAGEMQVLFLRSGCYLAGAHRLSCKSRALFLFLSCSVATTLGLLGTENRKWLPFAVAGYLRYKCSPVGIERAHNMVAQLWDYRATFIFQRRDFIGGSILEVNCD
jgi:hypothetical protein